MNRRRASIFLACALIPAIGSTATLIASEEEGAGAGDDGEYLSPIIVAAKDADQKTPSGASIMDELDYANDSSRQHSWCRYVGKDAFKITLFICVCICPLVIATFAYCYQLWRARIDIVKKYLEEGMSVRGIVMERNARTRTDLDGRSYKQHEIVVEYDPLFAACVVEGENEDLEQELLHGVGEVEEQEKDRFVGSAEAYASSVADQIGKMHRRRYTHVSRETFYKCAAMGSVRLLVLGDARSAYPVNEIVHLQQNSGVCWVWFFGLLVLASFEKVAVNASCAGSWHCWLLAFTIIGAEVYTGSLCTRHAYRDFVDSIVKGDPKDISKVGSTPSSSGPSGRIPRLVRVQSEPTPSATSTQMSSASHSKSRHFVVACPMVRL